MTTKTHQVICEGYISADQPGDTPRVVRWTERVTASYAFAAHVADRIGYADRVWVEGPDVPAVATEDILY